MSTVRDTVQKTWRHLNFFQYKAYIHARVPRVKSPGGAVQLITVPWARPGSGFTLLFETSVLLLVKEQPVSVVVRTFSVHDTLVWRMVSKYVERAREEGDLSEVTCRGADETNLEGFNSIIQNIKRRSCGFRNNKYFEAMIYLVGGGVDLAKLCDVKAWK